MNITELNEQTEKVIRLVNLILQTFPTHDKDEAYRLAIMAGLQDAWRKGYHIGWKIVE